MKFFRRKQKIAEVVVALGLILFLFAVAVLRSSPSKTERPLGVTFSSVYATQLGLDWRRAYVAMLDELQVKKIRLPIYWSAIAPTPTSTHWTDVDWMIEEQKSTMCN